MKKKFLQRTAALVIMTLLLSVTALAGSQDTAPVENTDAAGTESVSEIEEEGEETEVDPAKLEDENPSFQIASEEIAPLGMTGEQTADKSDKDQSKDADKPEQDKDKDADKPEQDKDQEADKPEQEKNQNADKSDKDKKEEKEDESGAGQEKTGEDPEKKGVMILFTSDIHCGVNEGFGLSGLYQIRKSMEKQGYEILLVDDGDAIQGETIGLLSKGESIIKLMNKMHYDVAIPGNHEFDYGMDQFFKLVDEADFPYISCNFTRNDELVFDPYTIKEAGNIKIGFVGVTTPRSIITSNPKFFQDEKGDLIYGFKQDETGKKLYDAVQKAVDDVRAEGADLVYLVAHLGNEEKARPWTYADVIANTNGIDVVLDGHSHDTEQVVMKNKDGEEVVRSAVGTKMNCIGYSRISPEGKIEKTDIWTWENKESAPALFGFDNKIQKKVDAAEEETEKNLGVEVGETEAELTIDDPVAKDSHKIPFPVIRCAETNLGDFCADAFRAQGGTDIGICNGGGIRRSIDKGKITMKELISMFPFNNDTCVVELTGQQILDALEWGSRAVPGENGGFLQVSGLSYEIHTYIDSTCKADESVFFKGVEGERRVKNVKVGDQDLDPEKTYTVCGTEYVLLDKGDGYSMFDGAEVLNRNLKTDLQIIVDYISDLGGVIGEQYADPYGQGRIVIVEQAP